MENTKDRTKDREESEKLNKSLQTRDTVTTRFV